MSAYNIMKKLVKNVTDGKSEATKESLLNKCNVFYANDMLTDEQYTELVAQINALTE